MLKYFNSRILSRDVIKGFTFGVVMTKTYDFVQYSLNKTHNTSDSNDDNLSKKNHDKIDSYDTNNEYSECNEHNNINANNISHCVTETKESNVTDHIMQNRIENNEPLSSVDEGKSPNIVLTRYVDPDRYDPKIIVFL